MNSKQVAFFIILVFIITIPTVYAQEISIGQKDVKKSSIQVIINSLNEIHVKHIIPSSNSPKQVDFIDGVKTNITVLDKEGNEKPFISSGDNGIVVLPSNGNTIIEYDLENVLFLKNNMLTWDFRYLETTSFIIPEEIDLIFVNNRPVYVGEKNGITCHGCQMILEYSMNMPKMIKDVNLGNKKFPIEIKTFAEINQFNFNQTAKSINFEVKGGKQIVITTIPLELLSGPYDVILENKKSAFSEFNNNGTHVGLSMRPDNSGNVSIIGTKIMGEEKSIQNNPLTANVSQNIITYIVLGIIVSVGLAVIIIIMKKKKSLTTTINQQDNT
ncbi:MAG: hypothetical protein ACE5RF_01455 [Nitrosarchaeum sp.]